MILKPNGDGTATIDEFDCPGKCGTQFNGLSGTVEFNKESEDENGRVRYSTTVTFDEAARRTVTEHGRLVHSRE